MNKKDLKEMLKSKANNINLPDKSSDILIKLETFNNVTVVENKVKNKKKKYLFTLIPSLSLAVVIIILIFIFLPKGKIEPNDPIINKGDKVNLTTSKEVIAKEVILAGSILNDNSTKLRRYDESDFRRDVDLIHEYLLIANMLMNENNIKMDIYINDNEEYKEYKYYMSLNYENTNLEFYYNESNPYYEDLDDLDEVSVDFSGLILIDNNRYDVLGHRENEENEEFETTTTIYMNDMPYLKVDQETEINEFAYEFTYYDNGKEYLVIEQEVEFEDGIKETNIKVKENNVEREFSFTYLKDYIETEYESDSEDDEFELEDLRIYDYRTYYLYVLENSEFKEIKKNK